MKFNQILETELVNINEAIKIKFKQKLNDDSVFQIIDRDTSGMKGKQDMFQMVIIKDKKIVKDLGTHPSLKGAIQFFKINKKRIEDMSESYVLEGKDDLSKINELKKDRTKAKKKIVDITNKLHKLEIGLEKFDLSKMTATSPERFEMRKELEKITKLEDKLSDAFQERNKADNQLKKLLGL
jgi:hypothetical protein